MTYNAPSFSDISFILFYGWVVNNHVINMYCSSRPSLDTLILMSHLLFISSTVIEARVTKTLSETPLFVCFYKDWLVPWSLFYTVRNLHFLSKNSILISRENCRFFWGVKNSWKCCGFGLFSCWQLWFHEKNCQKKFGWKTRENVGVLSKLNFWTKIWLLE